jgi:hypothetical protein
MVVKQFIAIDISQKKKINKKISINTEQKECYMNAKMFK